MPRILGIDPGLRFTGWAVVESKNNSFYYIASGVIKTTQKNSLTQRLVEINKGLLEVANLYKPHNAAIEETYVNKNYGSSLKLAHARGAAMLTVGGILNIDLAEYAAKTVKKTICGVGNAEKAQVEKMLGLIFNNITLNSADEADALSIALCHAMHFKG